MRVNRTNEPLFAETSLNNLLLLSPNIILVDDDPLYGKAFQRAAEIKGVACHYCATPQEFCEKLEAAFDIAILDYDLGAMTGLQLSQVVKRIAPSKFVLLTSSYRGVRELEAREDFIKGFLNKNTLPLLQVSEVLALWAGKRMDRRQRDRVG